ncbi:MAG: MBOAT family protein [Subdoligranulum sp.]|nr:MBOAT family protein [Subdoligranulum sp.]
MSSFFAVAFLVFFAGVCLVYFILPGAVRPFWLLVCSYLFYLYDPQNAGFVVLLAGASVLTWAAALLLERLRDGPVRRICLAAALVLCFGSLFYYKYVGFLGETLSNLLRAVGLRGFSAAPSLLAPVGISYFTFAAAGYVIDVYRGKHPAEKNLLYYALFVGFFPCIVTGPIERAPKLIPQLKAPQAFDYNRVTGGLFRILWGFFKKFVIANTIGGVVDAVYGNLDYKGYTGPVLLLASLLYTYQLYCDFSAGCDVAIGAGTVFGFTLTENFRQPLRAGSFIGLWRRWHISLTSWFRDYLYIPLGGNRKGALRQNLNQLFVFLVSGLWHGASLSMAVWGLLNGAYLCIGKATEEIRLRLARKNPLYRFRPVKRVIQAVIVYLLFTSCIVFFRASEVFPGSTGLSDALYLYAHLFTGWDKLFASPASVGRVLASIGLTWQTVAVLGFGVAVVETLESAPDPVSRVIRKVPIVMRWPLYYAMCLAMLLFGSFANSGSIYGRF